MNQKMKRIVVWILLVSLLIGIVPVVALTALADGENPEHSAKEVWAHDDNHHWHACTVEGCTDHTGVNAYNYGAHEFTVANFSAKKDGAENTYYYTCECGKAGTETYEAYTVTFATEHGEKPTEQTIIKDSTVTTPTAPTETGWRFDGWEKDGQKWNFTAPITEDIILTAKWTQVFTVTAGEKVNVSSAAAAKDDTVTVTVTPDTGYAVDKVIVTSEDDTHFEATKSGETYTFTMPEKDVTVEAEFKLSALTISPTSVPLLYVGGTTTLSVTPAGETVVWSSDDAEVATVADGVVTAHKTGSATITAAAAADSTVTATRTVQVANLAFTAEDKTISGKKGLPMDSTTLELTLSEGKLVTDNTKFTASNVAVSGVPAGVSYTVAPKSNNEKAIVLTFTGTPTEAKDGSLQISVSRELVQNAPAGDPVTVTANANAKWEVKSTHTVTITTMAAAHGSAALADTRTLYASGETVTVVPTMKAPFRVKSVTVSPTAAVTKTAAGYTFSMPDADVTVTVNVEVTPITSTIAEKSHVGSISLTNAAGLAEAIRTGSSSVKFTGTLTDDQKTAIADGRYSFKFTIAASAGTADNTALREQAVTKDGMHLVYNAYSDLTYFDISLKLTTYKENGTVEGAVISVTDTGSYKATITFPNLNRSPAKRLYYIHPGHDVKNYLAQSASSTNGNVVFDNLTQFSTYTLVRTSVESPQTGDRFPLEMLLTAFLASAMGLTAMVCLRKVKE